MLVRETTDRLLAVNGCIEHLNEYESSTAD